MNAGNIMLGEINQPQKDKYCMTPLTHGTWSNQVHTGGKENGVCQGLGREGNGELFFSGDRVSA